MKISSVIKKCEKAGWTVTESNRIFSANKPGSLYTIEWLRNGTTDEAVCLKVRRLTDKDDLQSDYHAGSYANSVKQALAWAESFNDHEKVPT